MGIKNLIWRNGFRNGLNRKNYYIQSRGIEDLIKEVMRCANETHKVLSEAAVEFGIDLSKI